jgi:hypothetical protein
MGRGHIGLHEQLSPGCANARGWNCLGRIDFHEGEARGEGLEQKLGGALHGSQFSAPSWLRRRNLADKALIGDEGESINGKGDQLWRDGEG